MPEPSRANWADEPRTCESCHKTIHLAGKSAREHGGAVFRTIGGVTTSFHEDCRYEAFRERREAEQRGRRSLTI